MVDFIILTKRGDGRGIILRTNDIVCVTDEGDFRIVHFREGERINLEHVREDIKVILNQIQQVYHV